MSNSDARVTSASARVAVREHPPVADRLLIANRGEIAVRIARATSAERVSRSPAFAATSATPQLARLVLQL
jgi:hypothetical protein